MRNHNEPDGALSGAELVGQVESRSGDGARGGILRFARRLIHTGVGGPALAFIGVVTVAAIFAPFIAPHDPSAQDTYHGFGQPSMEHLLGTDQLGRDVLSRLIYGSRVSLVVGFGSVALGMLVGVPLGMLSGYAGGSLDSVIMRVVDAIVAFPALVLALALLAALGPSLRNIVVAVGVANVPWFARILRGQVLLIREQEYVTAARTIGAGDFRIMAVHIFPNALAPLIVEASMDFGYAILAEAGLSFLGVGVAPPTPTWGNMLQAAFGFLLQAPWLSIFPGAAIFLLVLSFNLLGDALRDVLDPRLARYVR